MLFVHLHNLRIPAHHGVHAEERVLGNLFEVSLSVGFMPARVPVTELHETLDYTTLLQLVKERMALPTALLETIATELCGQIRERYPQVVKISISIKKLYPPINSFEGAVGVSFEWTK